MSRLWPPLASLASAALLWAPLLLWLLRLRPPEQGMGLHAATALLLALIAASALRTVCNLPQAAPAPGRYRVVPTAPHRPLLVCSVGISSLAWGVWRAEVLGADLLSLLALSSGGMALWLARRQVSDPIWGTWMELAPEALQVHCPRGEDWSVPLCYARALRRRPRDGSFLLETLWPERDVFVPSPAARARYSVSNHLDLFDRLAASVPVTDTTTFLGVARGPSTLDGGKA